LIKEGFKSCKKSGTFYHHPTKYTNHRSSSDQFNVETILYYSNYCVVNHVLLCVINHVYMIVWSISCVITGSIAPSTKRWYISYS